MTLRTALEQGRKLLEEAGVESPRLTAELLLAHALRRDRVWVRAHDNEPLPELGWIHYGRYLHERMRRKPLAYITKSREFYGREFRVEPGVLIPRPETELLVERALRHITRGMRVADVGTGSGSIAVTLAVEAGARVIACDISADALRIARLNASLHGAGIRFVHSDLISCVKPHGLDVIVSNAPYVPATSLDTLAPEVRDWEPHQALFADEDGLGIYRRLIPEAHRVLRPGGMLLVEIGIDQSAAMIDLLQGWRDIACHADLAGIPRVIEARTPDANRDAS